MADDERYCGNCRASIPPGVEVCPACGVYAGSVFDGKMPKKASGRRAAGGGRGWGWVLALLVLAGAGYGGLWYYKQQQFPKADTGPIRVVGDRPGGANRPAGAAISEPEAILTLRHHFAGGPEKVRGQCIAVMSRGFRDGAYIFDAVNSCKRAKLGRWKVDARTRLVSKVNL
jgi:hypothetical protein